MALQNTVFILALSVIFLWNPCWWTWVVIRFYNHSCEINEFLNFFCKFVKWCLKQSLDCPKSCTSFCVVTVTVGKTLYTFSKMYSQTTGQTVRPWPMWSHLPSPPPISSSPQPRCAAGVRTHMQHVQVCALDIVCTGIRGIAVLVSNDTCKKESINQFSLDLIIDCVVGGVLDDHYIFSTHL